MEIKRPPRLVAFDTEVFDTNNFNYKSTSFQTLVKFVKEKKIKLLLTSITLQEIRAHITEGADLASKAVNQAVNDLKKKRKKPSENEKRIKISKNSDLLYEFEKKFADMAPTFEQINPELKDQLDSFLQATEFERIEVDQVSVVEIFEKYFSGTPPFGESNKKHEFPDAFALFALDKEAKNRKKTIYVVSGDSDWEKFCSLSENLHCIGKLDELLETISRENDSDKVDVWYELYRQKEYQIERYIEDNFSNLDFSIDISGSGEIESGSETIKIDVNSVDITDSSLVYINDSNVDQPSVVFKLEAKVNYDANISFESLKDAIYYGKYYFDETTTINKLCTQSINFDVEVTLTLYRDKDYSLDDADIKNITIDPNNTLGEIIVNTGLKDYYY
ncbi:PIN domain-containing protein [Laspinema sp. D1]|uniref:PIN domain-containing protein n=1 Tax=Laspinema palackyanum D2a TaxID=2953684 RepID=A0ABT2MPI2_9CYAN|nr:PIN domain-containing protein [Laspinema sp. D2a]